MSIEKLYQKMTFRFLKISSMLISTMLGMICGFGCAKNVPVAAYGVLMAAYFKISGTVLSSESDLPIKGLSVSVCDTLVKKNVNSTKTDSLGKYSFELSSPPWNCTLDLNVKDIDSTENGSFTAKDTIISVSQKEIYASSTEKIVDIKLDKKE